MIALTVFRCWLLLAPAVAVAQPQTADSVALVKMEVRRLPSLNTPRLGHSLLWVDGRLMAAGGHTNGFVPVATAEFLAPGDTAWREQPTVYTHDFGTALHLSSGRVMLFGGAEQPLGIGQTFTVEFYDPATDTFEGEGCLDTKRMYAQAVELDSGRVYISGNWYHDDAVECYDGHVLFRHVKDVAQQLTRPYLFRTAQDDALILGTEDTEGDSVADPTIIDRLRGPAFSDADLAEWPPMVLHSTFDNAQSFCGDEAAGSYASLMAVQHGDGRVALALVDSSGVQPWPVTAAPATAWGSAIIYFSGVVVDRAARRAYLMGTDEARRHYVYCRSLRPDGHHRLVPDTVQGAARLYYSDPLPDAGYAQLVLTPDGHLVLVGGAYGNFFSAASTAYCFCVGAAAPLLVPAAQSEAVGWLWWLCGCVVLLAAVGVTLLARRRRRGRAAVGDAPVDTLPTAETDGGETTDGEEEADGDGALMERINQLMADGQLFLNPDLKVADVAEALRVKPRTVSDCIKSHGAGTFPQLVNKYRVDYACQLLQQHPDMKASVAGTESGFASDQSFFRAFKQVTGKTPSEWRAE